MATNAFLETVYQNYTATIEKLGGTPTELEQYEMEAPKMLLMDPFFDVNMAMERMADNTGGIPEAEEALAAARATFKANSFVNVEQVENETLAASQAYKENENLDEWRQKIEASKQRAKEQALAAIDRTFAVIEEVGQGKPQAVRNFLLKGVDAILSFAVKLWNKLVDFFKKVAEVITKVWNAIVRFVKNAIERIKRFFATLF